MTKRTTGDPEIRIPASRRRLLGLAVSGLVCATASLYCGGQLLPSGPGPWVGALVFGLFGGLFALWAGLALWVAWRQPAAAYRLDATGLYVGDTPVPAFTWPQVAGVTLSQGKRRSHLTVVLMADADLHRQGLLPDWLATFLGRPVARDLALTPMDTATNFATFLDLIGPYFRTYARQDIQPGDPRHAENSS